MPKGIFIKKAHLHVNESVRAPPVTGPIIDERAKIPASKPMYLPRSAGGKRSPTAINAHDINVPPPTPCIALNAISWFISAENPANIEPTTNTTMPKRKKARRP